ncbi:MAG: DUF1376 domain-containing protein [Sedimentisphaerales bacterium]|nr:DUF1376 domain-containing protein [Sedimentisphaerales bacterium]
MKVRYVTLDSNTYFSDLDFMMMTPAERGVYLTLTLYMYWCDGKVKHDPPALSQLCNCDDFENIWKKIEKKFQTRNGVIKHKRVTEDLRRAKKLMQSRKKSGLKGARKRWGGHSDPTSNPISDPIGEPIAK